ncbi:MAG: DUF5615 family PIN-like protein [Pyrinomonadaceae bacterium]
MKIRFQADADFNAEIIDGLIRREPAIDFQTADEANLRGLKDDKVLQISTQANRVLVSHDRKTMPKYFAKFILQKESPGVFIIAQNVSVGLAIETLLLIWSASEDKEWKNLIVDLPF